MKEENGLMSDYQEIPDVLYCNEQSLGMNDPQSVDKPEKTNPSKSKKNKGCSWVIPLSYPDVEALRLRRPEPSDNNKRFAGESKYK